MTQADPHPTRPTRRSLQLLAAVVLAAVVWNYWLPAAEDFYNKVTNQGLPPNIDFLAYYTAGQRFNGGSNPYYYGEDVPGSALISEYIYPPTFLPLYGALARLPYNTARGVWLALYFAAYLAAFALLAGALPRLRRGVFILLGAALTSASYPLLFHIRNGQADMLVIALVLAGYALSRRGQRFLPALLLALAVLLKVSPLFLLITYVLYQRNWRFGAYTLLITTALGLLSLLVVPASYYRDYLVYILPVVSSGTGSYLNQSLLKYLAGSPPLAQAVSAGGLLLFALFAAWLGRKAPAQPASFTALAVFTLNLLVILIFQGKAWSMAYVWTILPAALVLTHLLEGRFPRWVLPAAGLGALLLVSKVYGYRPLDSLNLFGALLMSALLLALIWPGNTKNNQGETHACDPG